MNILICTLIIACEVGPERQGAQAEARAEPDDAKNKTDGGSSRSRGSGDNIKAGGGFGCMGVKGSRWCL